MRRLFIWLLIASAAPLQLALIAAAHTPAAPAFSPTREPVSPDGTRAIVELPPDQHMRNTGGSDGAGLCVFTSCEHAGRWQNVRELDGFQAWMAKRPGGGWPEKVDRMIAQYAREKGVPAPGYIQHTGGDEAFLDLALKTDRVPCVTYAGLDDFYRDGAGRPQRIAHMVNLAHLDSKWAAIIDNNRPGVWVWMARKDFLARWRDMNGGWAVVFLAAPPPPHPGQAQVFGAKTCVCGDDCKCKPGECPSKCPVVVGQCGPDGCRVRTAGESPEQRTAKALPAGWRWEDTAQGMGLRDPDGNWYLPPHPENTMYVRRGYAFTPTPEFNPYPRGYWEGACVRDGACDGPVSSVVTTAQDGKPTDGSALAVKPFNPNDYPGGARIDCKPCQPEIMVTPIPVDVTPFAPAGQCQGGQCPTCPRCPNGQCPVPPPLLQPAAPTASVTAPAAGMWLANVNGVEWGYWQAGKCRARCFADGRCESVDANGNATGVAVDPPAPLPAGVLRRPAAGNAPTPNFGVDPSKVHQRPTWSINGFEVTRPEALAALGGGLADDSGSWHLTAVGNEWFRSVVKSHVDKLAPDVRAKLLFQTYDPADWPVKVFDLPGGVSLRKPSPVRTAAEVGTIPADAYTLDKLTLLLASAGGPNPAPAPPVVPPVVPPAPGPKMPNPVPPGPVAPKNPDSPKSPDAPPGPAPDKKTSGLLILILAGLGVAWAIFRKR